ncbi:hypothetical protein ACFTWS_27465 [Streptomyces sp. NPDC057027]|uniref:hypothetical protein n=1 Tax=Streptomyces sp. NPDC057027 TaxID=3346004 RepID=UPI0036331631
MTVGGGDGRELDECGGREAFVLVAADPCGLVGRGVDGGLLQTGPDGRQGPDHGLPGGVGGGADTAGAVLGARTLELHMARAPTPPTKAPS